MRFKPWVSVNGWGKDGKNPFELDGDSVRPPANVFMFPGGT
jgi:hypothetical protein